VLAGTLRMLDLGVFRTGGQEYVEQNGSRGATTLLLDHVEVDGDRLLSYRDGGQWQEVHAADLNARFKELAGERYTVKDLRTWHATVFAAEFLARREPPSGKTKARQVISRAMRTVADEPGNTPAVARRSYVDPEIVARFSGGETIARALRRAERADSAEATAIVDRAVISLLTRRRARWVTVDVASDRVACSLNESGRPGCPR
jgi:DNA topoisomerase IB